MTHEERTRQREIKERCANGESLRSIQKDYPVPLGTLGRVRDGHVVEAPRLRHGLRLSLYIMVSACWCGEVHQKKHQRPFADRIPSDEPDKRNILNMIEILSKAEDDYVKSDATTKSANEPCSGASGQMRRTI